MDVLSSFSFSLLRRIHPELISVANLLLFQRKIHSELTSVPTFLYFVCGLPPQPGPLMSGVGPCPGTEPGPLKWSSLNLTTRPWVWPISNCFEDVTRDVIEVSLWSLDFLAAPLVPHFSVCVSCSIFHARGIPQISSGPWLPIRISVMRRKQLSMISVGLMGPVSVWTQCFFRGVECWHKQANNVGTHTDL